MNHNISLGNMKGVPIGVHWSLFLISGLVAFSLTDGLEEAAGDGSGRWALPVTIIAVCLFLASVLAHEVGHALVALKGGIKVNRITLWLFGGVAELGSKMPTWKWALAVALAGPGVSFGLGVSFSGMAVLALNLGVMDVVVVALWWLGVINLVLAVFNMLPGAPLDGGRVLAALLWGKTGRQHQSEARAGKAGWVLGWTMAIFGTWTMMTSETSEGIWLVLMGLFLAQAAKGEWMRGRLGELAGSKTAGQVMRPTGAPVRDWMTVEALMQTNIDKEVVATRSFDGTATGVFNPEKLVRTDQANWSNMTVRDLAEPLSGHTTVSVEEPMSDALEKFEGPHTTMLVENQGQLVGTIGPVELENLLNDTIPAKTQ